MTLYCKTYTVTCVLMHKMYIDIVIMSSMPDKQRIKHPIAFNNWHSDAGVAGVSESLGSYAWCDSDSTTLLD